jgi:uncharacterized protein (DUF2267 family)
MARKVLKKNIWGIVTQKPISLSKLAKESWEPTKEKSQTISPEEKEKFVEMVSAYNSIGKDIYRENSLQSVTESIKSIVETASQVTVTETEDWFDRVTVQRHMKQLGEAYKTFEKTAKQIAELQQRLEASYEDMGGVLGRYYKMNESSLREESSDYQRFFMRAMKKFGVKSPDDFKNDKKRKAFFNWVDKNYVSKDEE